MTEIIIIQSLVNNIFLLKLDWNVTKSLGSHIKPHESNSCQLCKLQISHGACEIRASPDLWHPIKTQCIKTWVFVLNQRNKSAVAYSEFVQES